MKRLKHFDADWGYDIPKTCNIKNEILPVIMNILETSDIFIVDSFKWKSFKPNQSEVIEVKDIETWENILQTSNINFNKELEFEICGSIKILTETGNFIWTKEYDLLRIIITKRDYYSRIDVMTRFDVWLPLSVDGKWQTRSGQENSRNLENLLQSIGSKMNVKPIMYDEVEPFVGAIQYQYRLYNYVRDIDFELNYTSPPLDFDLQKYREECVLVHQKLENDRSNYM